MSTLHRQDRIAEAIARRDAGEFEEARRAIDTCPADLDRIWP